MSVRSTSIEAYNAIVRDGTLGAMRGRVYEALYHFGPMTGAELDKHLRSGSAHKRLSELQAVGAAEEKGARECKVSGRVAILWDVTTTVPSGPPPRPTRRGKHNRARDALAKIIAAYDGLGAFAVTIPDGLRQTIVNARPALGASK